MLEEMEAKNDTMLNLAMQMPESKGDLVALPQESLAAPAAGAVFAEPIVTAQPCRIRRNHADVLQKIKVLAQMAGEDYCYRFPVKNKDGSKKFIEGPTITLANDLAREYMNNMVDVRVVDQGGYYVFYGRFVDFETGFCMTRAFRQRKGQKTINTDAERAEDIVFQIGQSKAIRNVIVNALQSYADFMFREAKNSLVLQIGSALEQWREKMRRGITEKKYDLKRIEAAVGSAIDKWLAPDIARVLAELKSIADGLTSFDDLYPDPAQAKANNAAALNEEFLGAGGTGTTNTTTVINKTAEAIDPAVAAAMEAVKGKEKKSLREDATGTGVNQAAGNPTAASAGENGKTPASPDTTATSTPQPSEDDELPTNKVKVKATVPTVKPSFDAATLALSTRNLTEGALMRAYDLLEEAPELLRGNVFVGFSGMKLIEAADHHGIGENARTQFSKLGIQLPEAGKLV